MPVFCPQCERTMIRGSHCTSCGGPVVIRNTPRSATDSGLTTPWRQTPWGRILIGLILAQGLYYGLRQLVHAGVNFTGLDETSYWGTFSSLLIFQGLQMATLMIAGILVGAGKSQGLVYGMVVGVWNGVLCILIYPPEGEALTTVGVYGQPLIQAVFGGLGGWFGEFFWQPITITPRSEDLPAKKKAEKPRERFAGPFAWMRILIGSAVAIGGTIWADVIFDYVMTAGRRNLGFRAEVHAQLLTWEIMVLSVFAGAAFAGATTRSGLKQGLAVGLLTGSVVLGFHLTSSAIPLLAMILTLSGPILLGLVGGGFGGQLLPPIVKKQKRGMFSPV